MRQSISRRSKSALLAVGASAALAGFSIAAVAGSAAAAPPPPSQRTGTPAGPVAAPAASSIEARPSDKEPEAVSANAKQAGQVEQAEQAGQEAPQVMQAPADRVESTPAVSPAEVAVTALDARSQPVPGVALELVRDRQSVAEGNASSRQQTTTDTAGNARFRNLPTGSDSQYRVVALVDGKRYGTRPFALESRHGTSVTLHVYPVVSNVKQSLIAGRGFMFVEPRDQVLAFEFMQQFHNLGQSVLDADTVTLRLPSGWKAFSANQTDPDLTVVKTDSGVALVGAIAPGQHSVAFTFQVPSANRERVELELELWPNTAELQVATLARPGLDLSVDGFPSPNVVTSNGRQPWLVTGQSFTRAAAAPRNIHLQIAGLPVVGVGRWVASAGAALLAMGALLAGFRRRGLGPRGLGPEDGSHRAASARVIAELAALEQAHRAGEIGKETYAATREILLSAFVRLERELLNG